jgi:hypothetical protein
MRPVFALLLAVLLIGCQTAASTASTAPTAWSPSPSPTADGPEGLIADLEAAGADAKLGDLFSPDPLTGQDVVLCVGAEPVRLYVFGSVGDRVQAASRIDPKDPSNMGTSIVDWNGAPRFWQRDRMLILYLGTNADTEALLRGILGQPFASGIGRPPLRDDSCA